MPATYSIERALLRTRDPNVVRARKAIISIVQANTKAMGTLSPMLKKVNLTLPQFNALRILRGRNGKPASLQNVSSQMIHMNSNTTRVVDKLIAKDLVFKEIDKLDARQLKLTITDKGLSLLASLDQEHDKIDLDFVHNLTESEQKTLIKLLGKI